MAQSHYKPRGTGRKFMDNWETEERKAWKQYADPQNLKLMRKYKDKWVIRKLK